MRLHRIRLESFRGIERFELRLEDHGVTVIEGPNESGKTSVAQAIDLAFEHLDSANNRVVRALKPVHRDAGSEVEVELTTGPYRLVYRKRWHRQTQTVLTVMQPRPESMTGREAHERMRAILEETLDVPLWKALQVQQGVGDEQAALTGSRSLLAALDQAASTAVADAGGSLWQRVVDERARYWTAGGRPSAERVRLARELADEEAAVLRLRAEIDRLDDVAEEHRRAGERVQRLRAELAAARAVVVEREERWRAVELRRTEVEERRRALDDADRAVETGDREVRERARLVDSVRSAADESRVLDTALPGVRSAAAEADQARSDLLAERDAARTERRDAERAMRGADVVRDHHRRIARLEELRSRVARIRAAEQTVQAAAAVLRDGTPATVEDVAAVDGAHLASVAAASALRAGTPAIRVEALGDLVLGLDGATVPLASGQVHEHGGSERTVVEVPGVARIEVVGGAGAAALARAAADADERFAAVCDRLGLDRDDAPQAVRARAEACRAAESAVRDGESRLRELLGGGAAAVVHDECAALEVRVAEDLAADPRLAESDPATADLDRDRAAERMTGAADRELAAEQAIAPADDAVLTRSAALREAEVRAEVAAEAARGAAGRLDAARAAIADDALTARHGRSVAERTACRAALEAALAGFAALRSEELGILLQNAREVVTGIAAEIDEVRQVIAGAAAVLQSHGEDALQERLDAAEALQQRLAAEQRRTDRLAAAALRLHAALDARRRAERAAVVRPFQDRVEALGRVVFGETLTVQLDDDLRIVSRSLDGVAVPWDDLSTGTREQFGVVTRLACAAIVAPGGGVPVVLDDAFGYSDDVRLERIGAVLASAGRTGQVIVLTCSPDRFRRVGGARMLRMADLLGTAPSVLPLRLGADDDPLGPEQIRALSRTDVAAAERVTG